MSIFSTLKNAWSESVQVTESNLIIKSLTGLSPKMLWPESYKVIVAQCFSYQKAVLQKGYVLNSQEFSLMVLARLTTFSISAEDYPSVKVYMDALEQLKINSGSVLGAAVINDAYTIIDIELNGVQPEATSPPRPVENIARAAHEHIGSASEKTASTLRPASEKGEQHPPPRILERADRAVHGRAAFTSATESQAVSHGTSQFADPEIAVQLLRKLNAVPTVSGFARISGSSRIRSVVVYGPSIRAQCQGFLSWAVEPLTQTAEWRGFLSHGFATPEIEAFELKDGDPPPSVSAAVEVARLCRIKPSSARIWPPE